MGLRIDEGISLTRYAEISSESLSETQLNHLIADGLIERRGETISATASGRVVLNAVTEQLLLG